MSKPLVILLILSSTSVVTFTAGQTPAAVDCSLCHPYALCDGFHCSCKDGFFGNGLNCSDIDECTDSRTHNCSVGTCQNTIGSYICLCPRGYIHSEGSCVPFNECEDPSLYQCHPVAKCIYTFYRYTCVCPDGYYGNGSHCEIDECQRGACGFGMECTKSLGSYSCSDPCVSRTVLNQPRRSTNYTQSSFLYYDYYMNGWYQFVGSGGVRIPEYCVPIYRCNTNIPLWMNGTHPVIRDGIVNRTSCGRWSEDCCYWTSTIQVKACPQGYYVYKLIEIQTSGWIYSSFCTDPSTYTCKADEEWQLRNDQSGCFCKNPYNVTDLSEMVPHRTCEAFNMKATFHKCQFNDLSIYFNKSHVKDTACYDFQDDPVTNTFTILASLKVGGCGVQSYEISNARVTHKANIIIVVEHLDTINLRKNTLNITLQCSYELDMISSLNFAQHPFLSSINIPVPGIGEFQVYMALYKDINATIPYSGSEVVLSTDQFLHVGIFFLGGTSSDLVLVMKNCYVTPRNDANDSQKYYIIQNSCPILQNGTVSVLQNGVSNKGRVSAQMLKFVENSDKVYLHCVVSLCDKRAGPCAPDCSRAGSPSDGIGLPKSVDSSGLITVGPIRRSDPIPTTPRPIPTTPKPSSPTITTRASTQTCKADEEWQLRGSRSGCFCKDPYKVTVLSQVVPEKTCGSFEMTAAFHKCQFNDLSIYFNKSHVKDTACYNFQDDPVTNTFTVLAPLKVRSCGVQETNNTHITYKTVITINVDTFGTTPGGKTLTATLQCSYKLDMIASLNTVPDPIFRFISITVAGKGQFKVYMALYKNSNYTTPYSGSEVAMSTKEFLYGGVFFPGDTSNLVLVMKNCYATPSNDENDPMKYHFIQNSCKNKADGTINVEENGVSGKGRFSVKMFKFVGNSSRVFLHCAVSLCDSGTGSCAPVCDEAGSRNEGTRRAPQSYDGALSIGPIVGSGTGSGVELEVSSSTITSAHILWTLLIPTLTILMQSL
ncbi:uromodulin-like [Lithobates pipiens]